MTRTEQSTHGKFDAFISCATEIKEFAGPLARGLLSLGFRVWFDEFELSFGGSLNEKINDGLYSSTRLSDSSKLALGSVPGTHVVHCVVLPRSVFIPKPDAALWWKVMD